MMKIALIAAREFTATVMTKSFVIGMLITPLLMGLLIFIMPRLISRTPPKVEGQVAVVDPTGDITRGLSDYLRPERFAERREESRRKFAEATPEALKRQAASSPATQAAMQQSLDAALGEAPRIDVVALDPGIDLDRAKEPLAEPLPKQGQGPPARLALVLVDRDAVRRAEGRDTFGTYDLFVRGKLDDRLEEEITDGLRESIIGARVRASGLNRAEIEALTKVEKPPSRTVTAEGEQETNEIFNRVLPAGFMILLLVSVMTSGQYLLTTMVEEKSSRVVEVLLSAVSAMELMVGKILGQMAVGLVVLALFSGLGFLALVSFASIGLLDPKLIFFLIVFYVLASFAIAALMAAIGASVNDIREAQTLMTPVMMVIMVPWLLWLPISRDPNSLLATVLSFIPPVGNFVMLLRMTSTSPPPMWQTWVCILVGAAGVWGAMWFAAKVFRIGLLMYGKPPTFGTLIRWARMA